MLKKIIENMLPIEVCMYNELSETILQNVNGNKNLLKKIIENMLPIEVCMYNELSETILLFDLCYLHLDVF